MLYGFSQLSRFAGVTFEEFVRKILMVLTAPRDVTVEIRRIGREKNIEVIMRKTTARPR